jgi:hypothetical protein
MHLPYYSGLAKDNAHPHARVPPTLSLVLSGATRSPLSLKPYCPSCPPQGLSALFSRCLLLGALPGQTAFHGCTLGFELSDWSLEGMFRVLLDSSLEVFRAS